VVVISVLAVSLTAACRGSDARVLVKGFRFQPKTMTVAAGTEVTWRQEDNTIHTLTSGVPGNKTGTFDRRSFGQGDEFSFTFSEPGTFRYFCDIHESMRGLVTVR
jgi:plastocyanin